MKSSLEQCSHQDFVLGTPRARFREKWGPCRSLRETTLLALREQGWKKSFVIILSIYRHVQIGSLAVVGLWQYCECIWFVCLQLIQILQVMIFLVALSASHVYFDCHALWKTWSNSSVNFACYVVLFIVLLTSVSMILYTLLWYFRVKKANFLCATTNNMSLLSKLSVTQSTYPIQ